jgi:hypothetical protein
VFLILVLQLPTVAGFSPVAAGTALLPLTVTGPHPLVPPALFANPVFSAASAATLLPPTARRSAA